jgi:uncharacterized membrane protein
VKRLSKYFLRGLLTFLPFALTVIIFINFVRWTEDWTAKAITWYVGETYIPGMGLAVAIAAIVLLGFTVSQPIFNRLVTFIELPFKNVPLIKSIYSALRSLSDYFSPGGDSPQQVVMVKIPSVDLEFVGFLTRRRFNDLPKDFQLEDRVAVYFPMSYAVGGYTMFIPRAWIRPVSLPVEVAMRSALTAWMPGRSVVDKPE